MLRRWLAALVLAGLAFCAHAEVAVPALANRVTDLTGTLTQEQAASLEQKLAAFETRKGSQIAVLMLPSTQPEEIEQFSIRVAEAWKIGRKGTDDGVILVVAKNDRRLRIEVGYGLEGAIPDATAKRIISESITPRFKAGDFYGGITAGVDQLIRLIDGEKLPPPAGGGSGSARLDGDLSFFDVLIPGLFVAFFAGAILRALFGRTIGAVVTGLAAGAAGWLLFSVGYALLGGVLAFILTLLNSGKWTSGSGGYTSGGGFGGGSSSDSGGFSGGGGSFGGGGSSGSW